MSVQLTYDVLFAILDELRRISRSDLLNFALASREFFALARPHIYHTVTISDIVNTSDRSLTLSARGKGSVDALVGDDVYEDIFTQLKDKKEFSKYTRELRIGRIGPSDSVLTRGQKTKLEPQIKIFNDCLVEFISCRPPILTTLKDVIWLWESPITQSLIDALLRHYPYCVLSIQWDGEYSLDGGPNLVSLDAEFGLRHLPCIQRILLHSPNIRRLSLTVWLFAISFGPIHLAITFPSLRGGIRYPFLEELSLEGYKLSISEAEDWFRHMDMTRLWSLELKSSTSLFIHALSMGVQFPALTRLCLELFSHESQQLEQLLTVFLQNMTHGLRELLLVGPYHALLEPIVTHHGSTLRILVLYDRRLRSYWQKITLTQQQLIYIGEHCPLLAQFSFDVGDWKPIMDLRTTHGIIYPWSTAFLDAVTPSTFPRLRSLTLCIPSVNPPLLTQHHSTLMHTILQRLPDIQEVVLTQGKYDLWGGRVRDLTVEHNTTLSNYRWTSKRFGQTQVVVTEGCF